MKSVKRKYRITTTKAMLKYREIIGAALRMRKRIIIQKYLTNNIYHKEIACRTAIVTA
jgi:hypothetical protein